jgi:hypothetical protein
MSETLDRLERAILRLSQDGSIKDRLADAYATHLIDLDAEALPKDLREGLDELNFAMHREAPLPRESAIRASVRKMSNQEAGHLAAMVVLMFTGLARAEHGMAPLQRPSRVASPGPVVQLFAEA